MPRIRNGRWQADVTVRGRRVRRSFDTEAQALAFESNPEGAELTLQDLFDAVLDRRWRGSKNERTATINAQKCVDYFGGHRHPGTIDETEVDLFVKHLQKEGNKPATVNRKLAALGVMLKYAYARQQIDRMPVIEKLREPKGRLRWLTKAEAARLLDGFEGEDTALACTRFLLGSGCRLSEALRARGLDVLDDKVVFEDTKNGDTRSVPLSPLLRKALEGRDLETAEHLFPLSPDQYRRLFFKARDRAGLGDEVVVHTLRHTVASWMVQAGVPLRAVQEYLGHRSMQVTMRYAHLAPSGLDAAAAALEV